MSLLPIMIWLNIPFSPHQHHICSPPPPHERNPVYWLAASLTWAPQAAPWPCAPASDNARCANSRSGEAPCQCIVSGGILTVSPGFSTCGFSPLKQMRPTPERQKSVCPTGMGVPRGAHARRERDDRAAFEHEADGRRFLDMMRERTAEFALTPHPEKTRLITFGRLAAAQRAKLGVGKPETFDFLGFTHICGRTRQGRFQIRRKSRRDRRWAKLWEIKDELRRRMQQPIPEQGRWLKLVITGYYAYHAVPTNSRSLGAFRDHVVRLWGRTLRRRSQKHASTWERIGKVADDWLSQPRILHPWPSIRFAVKHPR